MLTLQEKTQAIVDALEEIKGNDIVVIDTSKKSAMFDRMIIASANSNRQTRALAHNVVKKLEERGEVINSTEGEKSGEWVLIDMGEIWCT
jgi:ribosome-associated protein